MDYSVVRAASPWPLTEALGRRTQLGGCQLGRKEASSPWNRWLDEPLAILQQEEGVNSSSSQVHNERRISIERSVGSDFMWPSP